VGHRARDLALFGLALDSKLRGCDLIRLRVSDPSLLQWSEAAGRNHATEDGAAGPFEVTEQARRSVAAWIEEKGLGFDAWLIPSRVKAGCHLTTRQYARLVDKWVALIGLDPAGYGTHSLRRTKVALLYKKTQPPRLPASGRSHQAREYRSLPGRGGRRCARVTGSVGALKAGPATAWGGRFQFTVFWAGDSCVAKH
jgi:integrase